MQDQNAIEVNNITKGFKIYNDKGRTLKERLIMPGRNKKEIREVISNEEEIDKSKKKATKKEKKKTIEDLTKEMKEAARQLDFERAMELRDAIFELESD